jgi:HrpA-like RNA helicase
MCGGFAQLDLTSVQHFLKRAIDPPEVSAMDKAWNVLEELGAIDADGRLTALGRHIVRDRSHDRSHASHAESHICSRIVNAPCGLATGKG